jgi:hypothetical protein
MGGTCSKCGKSLASLNHGPLCFACVEKRLEDEVSGGKPYYDVRDMMNILGIEGEEQVRRKGRGGFIPGRIPGIKRHLYLKETIDEWIRSAGDIPKKPSSPAQEEAYGCCADGDHDWLSDEDFAGIAYRKETISEEPNGMVYVLIRRTCYFCGHTVVGAPQ